VHHEVGCLLLGMSVEARLQVGFHLESLCFDFLGPVDQLNDTCPMQAFHTRMDLVCAGSKKGRWHHVVGRLLLGLVI
jgi:hypothetical protein